MGEGAWSCFARLPPGLADQSVTLTLNWLRPTPMPGEFDLKADEIEGVPRRRNVRLRNLSVGLWALLALGMLIAAGAERSEQFALLEQPQSGMAAVWAAVSLGVAASLGIG